MSIPTPSVIQPVSKHTYIIIKLRNIIVSTRSKYQNIDIVELEEYGKALVLDNLVQSTEIDEHIYHECLVHPAMITHPNPKRILVIGGGEGATVREVLKHPIEKVIMVDIDEDVVKLSKQYLRSMSEKAFTDKRAEILIMDGKEYIEKTSEIFDIIILDLTDPYASEIAYELYTEKFYVKVKEKLTSDGMIVTQAGSSFYYEEVYDRVLNSVKSTFPIVREYNVWIPSFGYACNFIIGSLKYDPEKLSIDEIDRRIGERKIHTKFYSAKTHIALFNLPIYRRSSS